MCDTCKRICDIYKILMLFTSIKGRKLTRKQRKMVSIIRVSLMSSRFCWTDCDVTDDVTTEALAMLLRPSIVPDDEASAAAAAEGRLPPPAAFCPCDCTFFRLCLTLMNIAE